MADRLFAWIDADGTQWDLNGETNYQVIVGPSGMYGIPTTIVTQEVPQQPGTTEKYVQYQPSTIVLPMVIYADTEDVLDQVRRALKWAMSPSRGVGLLRHQANDGTIRELNCRLVKGFEGDETARNRGPGAMFVQLQFFAADPYWYDENFTQLIIAASSGNPFLGSTAFLPISLSPFAASGVLSIQNTGDAIAWPVWHLQGAATSLKIQNNTTGDVLNLPITAMASLTDPQSVTIDCNPVTGKTILREDATKHFEYLDPLSSLWGLAVGHNSITVTITGNDANTLLTVQYKQKYEGV